MSRREVVQISEDGKRAVQRWLAERGMNWRDLAKGVGFHAAYISHIMRGSRGISTSFCKAVHRFTEGAITCDMLIVGSSGEKDMGEEQQG